MSKNVNYLLIGLNYKKTMKNLLISGQTLQEWDIDKILTENEPKKSLKQMVEDMEFNIYRDEQNEKDFYETFHLAQRIKNY